MNQGKIWLVVKPTVGLPLFLGGVAVIALAVHAAVLTNTKWYPAYYSGKAAVAAVLPAKTAMAAPAAAATVAVAQADATTLVAKAAIAKP
jgi:light-harvesting protein B-800-850 alpha chain